MEILKKDSALKKKKGNHDKQRGVVWRVKRRSLAQNHKNTEANNYQTYVRNARQYLENERIFALYLVKIIK